MTSVGSWREECAGVVAPLGVPSWKESCCLGLGVMAATVGRAPAPVLGAALVAPAAAAVEGAAAGEEDKAGGTGSSWGSVQRTSFVILWYQYSFPVAPSLASRQSVVAAGTAAAVKAGSAETVAMLEGATAAEEVEEIDCTDMSSASSPSLGRVHCVTRVSLL